MSKQSNEKLRNEYVALISKLMAERDEDVQLVKSNEIALPVVDEEGYEQWIVITVKVPTGTREGEVYDGYLLAEDYAQHVREKAEKAEVAARKKAEKIARDQKMREEKAALKAAREAENN